MARIASVNLPAQKRVEVALTYLFGIGPSLAKKILAQTKINPDTRVKNLTETEVNRLREVVEKNYRVEGDLRREILINIKRLKEIGCYRGIRHIKHLPCRGQHTKNNTRTIRGNVRRTMGSGRTKSAEKT